MTKPAFLRLNQIVRTKSHVTAGQPLIPVSRSTWWLWVRAGKAPKPIKLGKRTTAWRSADIDALIATLNAGDVTKNGRQ